MSEMSDTFKLVNAMELAKTARVGMSLTYFDVIELLGEIKSLYEYIDELEAERRWIPVSERLPEVYRDEDGEFIPFLVCENDKDFPYRALYDGLNWGDGMFVVDVTHWMPLPEPPEVQE